MFVRIQVTVFWFPYYLWFRKLALTRVVGGLRRRNDSGTCAARLVIGQCVRTRATNPTPASRVRSDVLSIRYNISSACSNVCGGADVRYQLRGRIRMCVAARTPVVSPVAAHPNLCGDLVVRSIVCATRTPVISSCGCTFDVCVGLDTRYQSFRVHVQMACGYPDAS